MSEQDLAGALRGRLRSFTIVPSRNAIGRVLSCSDGIAEVSDMAGVKNGELISFACGAYGIAMTLEKNYVGVAVFSRTLSHSKAVKAYGTGGVMEIPCGKAMLGACD